MDNQFLHYYVQLILKLINCRNGFECYCDSSELFACANKFFATTDKVNKFNVILGHIQHKEYPLFHDEDIAKAKIILKEILQIGDGGDE